MDARHDTQPGCTTGANPDRSLTSSELSDKRSSDLFIH